MEIKYIENQSFGIWFIITCAYLLLILLSYLVIKKKWAEKQSSLIGFRTIMSFRSDITWHFANTHFFNVFSKISIISLLIHVVYFSVTKNPEQAFVYSRNFYGISFILLVVLLEVILIYKFNWKGEFRKK